MREREKLKISFPDWPAERERPSAETLRTLAASAGYTLETELSFENGAALAGADVAVLCRPESLETAAPLLDRERQLLVYLAEECRGLRCPEAERRETARREWELCHAAHLILSPRGADADALCRCYGAEPEKLLPLPDPEDGESAAAGELLALLRQRFREKVEHDRPFFSVVVPSYERHDSLERLLSQLTVQSYGDFEVIVVDQSAAIWTGWAAFPKLELVYHHIDTPGAVHARNVGIRLARGHVVAFTDDDCIPEMDWLRSARPYFDREEVAGLEGRVFADVYESTRYRVVTNAAVEGVGFMTANLFARRDVLLSLGGFDENFDHPHFREDTELGWRLLGRGEVPYAPEAAVLHPSALRREGRDSLAERNKFFVHDALLLQKDPERFLHLFLAEGHYRESAYWDFFRKGMDRHGLPLSEAAALAERSGIPDEYIPEWLKESLRKRRETAT